LLPNAAEVDEVVKEKRYGKHMKRFKRLVFAAMEYITITNGRFKTAIRA
jgi:hypothetical protein